MTMDAKQILEQLLASGKTIAAKGEELVGERIGIPEAGPERDAMLKGLGKGAAAAGVLALILGTGAGRRLAGTALKLGSIAAIGGIGYTALKNWQAKNGQAIDETPIDKLTGEQAQARSRQLLSAMIAAAKADGHIDSDEQAHIEKEMANLELGPDLADFLDGELARPLSAADIAAGVTSQETAVEIWLASRMMLDPQNVSERTYLDSLTRALNLDAGLVAELEDGLKSA